MIPAKTATLPITIPAIAPPSMDALDGLGDGVEVDFNVVNVACTFPASGNNSPFLYTATQYSSGGSVFPVSFAQLVTFGQQAYPDAASAGGVNGTPGLVIQRDTPLS